MRYFAMIDGERRGPFTLEELADAGVRPDTYVWCKGMDDWQEARYDADICRMFRQRIFAINHPEPPKADAPARVEETAPEIPEQIVTPHQLPNVEPVTDTSVQPTSMLLASFLLTFFCFPFTGMLAIYYSVKARKSWEVAQRSQSKGEGVLYTEREREQLRVEAHDYARRARMWCGITFFLGIIFYALMGQRLM